jgi:hypothetical protein
MKNNSENKEEKKDLDMNEIATQYKKNLEFNEILINIKKVKSKMIEKYVYEEGVKLGLKSTLIGGCGGLAIGKI